MGSFRFDSRHRVVPTLSSRPSARAVPAPLDGDADELRCRLRGRLCRLPCRQAPLPKSKLSSINWPIGSNALPWRVATLNSAE